MAATATVSTSITPDLVEQFHQNGFLVFPEFLSSAEVAGLRSGISEMVRSLVEGWRAGKNECSRGNWDGMRNYSGYRIVGNEGSRDSAADNGFYVLLEPDIELTRENATFDFVESALRKIASPSRGSAAFKNLAEHPRLIALLEALIGQNPILYGNQALCKPPRIGSHKPWHQDSAYFRYEPVGAGAGAWIALDDASADNGCMFVLPGGHKLGPKKHVHVDDCMIEPGRVDISKAVPVEMKAGGLLLFSPMLPHYTPPNRSNQRRRAVQIFYRAAHTKEISAERHGALFADADGTPATCHAAKKG